MSADKSHLGDAVYADHDGIDIILTAEDGVETKNTIYLEPGVMEALIIYYERLKQKRKEQT